MILYSEYSNYLSPRPHLESVFLCREWYNRLLETNCIYKHLEFSRERFLRLDERLHFINPTEDDVKSSVTPYFFDYGVRYRLIHCDSLFWGRFDIRATGENKLYLWNPYQGRRQHILPMDFFSAIDHYGIGYHGDSPRDYKVLRFYDGRSEEKEEEGKHKKYYQNAFFVFFRQKRVSVFLPLKTRCIIMIFWKNAILRFRAEIAIIYFYLQL